MIIIDTSIWIEFFKQNVQYSGHITKLLETQKILAVECIFGELLQGVRNNREREIINMYWENLPKCKDDAVWIEAGNYSSEHKLVSKGVGLIDTVILISARRNKARVWTLDKKLAGILKSEEIFIL
jgi:predicted nucleic acid-binding protein